MKIKSCAWLVCLILCLPITMKAQVLKIENGMAFSSLVNEGEDLFDKSLSSYQMSIGLDYLDQGWYALSSNVGYLRKGGSFDFYEATDPGLNMLKNEFSPYYVAGVRLSWNFGSLYTLRNDRRVIAANRQLLDSNRDVFLFNTRLQATQQGSAVESVRRQMADDDEIIRLRTSIRKASEAKVANGTMTVTDMLRDMTSENLARQTKALHEVQLLMNMYQLKYTTNN